MKHDFKVEWALGVINLNIALSVCLSMYLMCANLKGGLSVNVKLHFRH